MNHFRLLVVVVLLAAVPLAAAETWRPAEHPATIERRLIGFTRPAHVLQLASEVAARLETLHVDTGDRVPAEPAWSPVVQLDATFARLERDRIAASRALAEAEVARLQAELAVSERQLAFRQGEVDRIADLATAGRVRKRDLDEAVFARDRVELGRASTAAALQANRQQVAVVQQQLREIDERIARHTVRAPAGWIVTARLAEPGSWVQPGQVLLELAEVDELAIDLHLAEEEVRALPADGRLSLHFPRQGEAVTAPARVHRVSPTFEARSKKRLVELRIDGAAAPEAAGGLTAALSIAVADPSGGHFIPERFLIRRYEQVFVVPRDAETGRIPIQPLRSDHRGVIVDPAALPDGLVLRLPEPAEPDGP